jgi:hypothetical protein
MLQVGQGLAHFWEQVEATLPQVQAKLERRSAAGEQLPVAVQEAVTDKWVAGCSWPYSAVF